MLFTLKETVEQYPYRESFQAQTLIKDQVFLNVLYLRLRPEKVPLYHTLRFIFLTQKRL